MAGTVKLAPDDRWTAASWLFDWTIESLARASADSEFAATLRQIVKENLGWLDMSSLPTVQRSEALSFFSGRLVETAERQLPADLPGRPRVLAHLSELSTLARDRLNADLH
jgi:hypothetical protein